MIRVTIEMLPLGSSHSKEVLGIATLTNDGFSLEKPYQGNYDVTLYKRGGGKRVWRTGRVKGFPRKRLGSWDLLYRALREIVGERNPQ